MIVQSCREATAMCFYPSGKGDWRRRGWLLVEPERRRPLPPAHSRSKVGASTIESGFRSQPSLGHTCDNLVRHRPSAQPNCLRCAMQVGGLDFLLRTVLLPWSRRAGPLPVGFNAMSLRRLKRKAAFRLLRPKKAAFVSPKAERQV